MNPFHRVVGDTISDCVTTTFVSNLNDYNGTREFMEEHNMPALADIADRLQEAIDRGLWTPKSNSAKATLQELSDA